MSRFTYGVENLISITGSRYDPKYIDKITGDTLPDASYCKVTNSINGNITLVMQYPIQGFNSDKLQQSNILWLKVNRYQRIQPMRIYSVKRTLSKAMIEVKAEHITNDLRQFVTQAYQITILGNNGKIKAKDMMSSYAHPNGSYPKHQPMGSTVSTPGVRDFPYVLDGDSTTTSTSNTMRMLNVNLLEMLGGVEGSVLDRFGGEFERDNARIYHRDRLGRDRGYKVEYGLNMTELEFTYDLSDTLYGIAGSAQYRRNVNGTEVDKISYSVDYSTSTDYRNNVIKGNENSDLWFNTATLGLDVTSYCDKDILETGSDSAVTSEVLRATRDYITKNQSRFVPKVNIKVNFVTLYNKTGYDDFLGLADLQLGDDVTVRHLDWNLDFKTRLISYEYDVLSDDYTQLELGQPKGNFLTSIREDLTRISTKAFNVNSLQD